MTKTTMGSPSKTRGISVAPSSIRVNRRRKSCTPAFTIVLLVLSHSVWNTLQCTTSSSSSSQAKHRPGSVNVEQQQRLPLEEQETNELMEETTVVQAYGGGAYRDSTTGELVNVPGKKDRDHQQQLQSQQSNEETIRACNNRLLDALKMACGMNNYYFPSTPAEYAATANSRRANLRKKRSDLDEGVILQRRLARNVVNDCCNNQCKLAHLMTFCLEKNRIPSAQTSATKSPARIEPTQFVPTPSSPEEPEPALYISPLVAYLLSFVNKQLTPKHSRPVGGGDLRMVVEGENNLGETGDDRERDLPLPQARIQDPHHQGHSSHQRRPPGYHHQQQQQQAQNQQPMYTGNGNNQEGRQMVRGNMNGASFNTNFATTALHNTQHQTNQGHHNHHHHNFRSSSSATNPGASDDDDERMTNNFIQPIPIQTFANSQGQQVAVGEEASMEFPGHNVHVLTTPHSRDASVFRYGQIPDDGY